MSEKIGDLYENAVIKMKEGDWNEGRSIALKCVKMDPNFLGGWKLMYMYEIRKATLDNKKIQESLKTDDVPYKLIEMSVTDEKIIQFRKFFLKHLKDNLNQNELD
jgi:hypothetical protein